VKYSEFIRFLQRHGWSKVRQEGSHIIMKHPNRPNNISVPNHGAHEIGKGLYHKILKDAGLKNK
jgi:predicted RNA binding protein YcfA (HicA-like mRNA interferase family)